MAIVKNNFQMLDSMIRLWNLESVNRVISMRRTGIFPAEAQGFALSYVLDFFDILQVITGVIATFIAVISYRSAEFE